MLRQNGGIRVRLAAEMQYPAKYPARMAGFGGQIIGWKANRDMNRDMMSRF
jgi:hypothetical protein